MDALCTTGLYSKPIGVVVLKMIRDEYISGETATAFKSSATHVIIHSNTASQQQLVPFHFTRPIWGGGGGGTTRRSLLVPITRFHLTATVRIRSCAWPHLVACSSLPPCQGETGGLKEKVYNTYWHYNTPNSRLQPGQYLQHYRQHKAKTVPKALPTAIPTALPTAIPTALPTTLLIPTTLPTVLPIPRGLPTAITYCRAVP